LLIRGIEMGETSRLCWLIGLVKHAAWAYSFYFLYLLLLHSCSYTDIDCPVIEVSSFWEAQQSVSPSPEGRNRSSYQNVMFSDFLEYRTLDKVQKPSNSVSYTPSSDPFRVCSLCCCFLETLIVPLVVYSISVLTELEFVEVVRRMLKYAFGLS
jgi:hypothetical protein